MGRWGNNRRCGLKPKRETIRIEHSIMQNTIAKDTLREYVMRNEVVFQAYGDLIEVANEAEKGNKEALLSYFDDASSVEEYDKGHWFIKEEFADLDEWVLI